MVDGMERSLAKVAGHPAYLGLNGAALEPRWGSKHLTCLPEPGYPSAKNGLHGTSIALARRARFTGATFPPRDSLRELGLRRCMDY